MNRGSQTYLRHFFGALAMMVAGMLLGLLHVPILPSIMLFGSFVYVIVLTAGLVLQIGPFRYVGKLYVQSPEPEDGRTKQPWETDA